MSTRGIKNNNPGNIERSLGAKWQGMKKIQVDERFIEFETPEDGIRAIAKTIITYYEKRVSNDGSKIDTVKEIIERWAPPIENNTTAYASHVADLLKVETTDIINVYDFQTMKVLVEGIIKHENAGYKYPEEVINKGIALAGLIPPKKPITKSKTIAGAVMTSVGTAGTKISELATPLNNAKESLTPFMDIDIVRYACLGLTVTGIALTLYAYLTDRKKRIT